MYYKCENLTFARPHLFHKSSISLIKSHQAYNLYDAGLWACSAREASHIPVSAENSLLLPIQMDQADTLMIVLVHRACWYKITTRQGQILWVLQSSSSARGEWLITRVTRLPALTSTHPVLLQSHSRRKWKRIPRVTGNVFRNRHFPIFHYLQTRREDLTTLLCFPLSNFPTW